MLHVIRKTTVDFLSKDSYFNKVLLQLLVWIYSWQTWMQYTYDLKLHHIYQSMRQCLWNRFSRTITLI